MNAGGDVTIVSSDKDLMQLVRPGVTMFDGMKAKRIGRDEVIEKFGVPPEKVIDVQALAGDSVDNVPGVPGIGVKTAAELIITYGDLDTLLARAGEIKQPKRREKLIEFAEQARISRSLVLLKDDVSLEIGHRSIRRSGARCRGIARLFAHDGIQHADEAHRGGLGSGGAAAARDLSRCERQDERGSDDEQSRRPGSGEHRRTRLPQRPLPQGLLSHAQRRIDRSKYETVTTRARLDDWIGRAVQAGRVAFDTETTDLNAIEAELVGLSLAVAPGEACYIPLGHTGPSGDLFGGADNRPQQLDADEALALLRPLLEDPSILKIGQNIKYDTLVMKARGINVAPFDDTMLLSYALDGGRGQHGMDALAERHLGHACMTFAQAMGHAPGAKKSDKTFAAMPLDKATEYAAEDADVTLRLWMALKPRLAAERMTTVYETLERPLVPVIVADGARRHQGRPRYPFTAFERLRATHGPARRRDQWARRPQVQSRIAEATRRTAVRSAEAAGRQEDEERPVGNARQPAR